MRKIWMVRCLLLPGIFAALQAYAVCNFNPLAGVYPQNSLYTYTFPFVTSAIFSVPADTPVGQVIYQQQIGPTMDNTPGAYRITCTTNGLFRFSYSYSATPRPLSPLGNVYQTNLAGVGVRFVSQEPKPFPTVYSFSTTMQTSYSVSQAVMTRIYMELVKTGDINAGTINGNALPTARVSLGQTGSFVALYDIKISGSLSVTTPTCNVAPTSGTMSVTMGSYKASEFTGAGSGTDWKDASITVNCSGRFYGNSGVNTPVKIAATSDGKTNTARTLQNNIWEMTLTPGNGVIDSANGIMKLKNETQSAGGIGIQLSTSASDTNKINLANKISDKISKTAVNPTITVPLYARYIQTASTVTAGKANGSLIYTISYR